ncbi:FRG domain-containing protein [Actomonas aquatica]|uniref:FRG domain-containing protein n=1 Tax=Actomonas aquatica TaxID=2866162 RepID=A0ABZ1C479_9BACT|nr:FRG domain-containing protein [Opitutus sp. WL0086]WRQ86316.1 FRG domain-containing protein [Opitutus sp. WL0086]
MARARFASPAPAVPPEAARTIRTIGEAVAALTDDAFMKDIRPGSSAKRGDDAFGLWFRGHERSNYELTPGMLRNSLRRSGRYVDEVSLVRHFKAMNPDAAPANASDFEWLVTMQHYLTPTRLLDWTENLLVALYFAVRNPAYDDEADAALWLLNARRLNYHTSATARMAELAFDQDPDVVARAALSRSRERIEWHDTFVREMATLRVDRADYRIERIEKALVTEEDKARGVKPVLLDGREVSDAQPLWRDLRDYTARPPRGAKLNLYHKTSYAKPEGIYARLRMPVAVYANRTNSRIRSQAGVFTLHGGKHVHNPNTYVAGRAFKTPVGLPISLVEIDAGLQRSRLLKWLCIPADCRADMRKALAIMGVTEATLFPELDYQSRYLLDRWTYESEGVDDDGEV